MESYFRLLRIRGDFVYEEGIKAGGIDSDGGFRAVTHSFADDRQWHAFDLSGGRPAMARDAESKSPFVLLAEKFINWSGFCIGVGFFD